MNKQGESARLKQFLLDNLSEKETEEIGLQIISDEDFEEKMMFAEESLIEDFLEDSLSSEEKELFFSNFLTCQERIEILEETALMKKYAQTHFVKKINEINEINSTGFFQILKNFVALNLRPIAAVLIILLIVGVVWRVFIYDTNGGLTQIEKDYAALNQKDLSSPTETANFSNKSLVAGTFRDNNSAAKLNIENLTENILFRLALPSETAKETNYNLELINDRQTIFRQNNLRIYQNQNGQEIKVILPKSVLPKGQSQIRLTNASDLALSVVYNFTIE